MVGCTCNFYLQHLSTSSIQTAIDKLTSAEQVITQAKTILTSSLARNAHMSLSPIAVKGASSTTAASTGCACYVEVDGVQFLSPPGHTSSPSEAAAQNGHTSSLSETAAQNGLTFLPSETAAQNGHASSPSETAGQNMYTSSPSGLDMCSAPEVSVGAANEKNEGRSKLERKSKLILDLTGEKEGEKEGMDSKSPCKKLVWG